MTQPDEKAKKRRRAGSRLGPDTWEQDGRPHYQALLVERRTHPQDDLGSEPYRIEPVLADEAGTAVEMFNADPDRNGHGAERAVMVIVLFTNMSGGSPDRDMRELVQRAFHYIKEHVGENGEGALDEPALLRLVFETVEQSVSRAYVAGLAARDPSPPSPRR